MIKSTNKHQKNIYTSKLNKYIPLLNGNRVQTGGTNQDVDTGILATSIDIIKNKYTLFSELQDIQNIPYNISECKMSFFGNKNERENILIKEKYKFNCILRPVLRVPEIEFNNKAYLFKKNFSLDFTDIFMQKTIRGNNLSRCTNYVYTLLNYTLSTFKEVIIRYKKFGPKTNHILDNVILLYKGGNTTRLIFRCFIDSIKLMLPNTHNRYIAKSRENLDNLISSYNIGDWDYNININYDELVNNGFTIKELDDLHKLLIQVFYYSANIIKTKMTDVLKSDVNIDNTVRAIQTYINSQDNADKIDKFITTYNQYATTIDEMTMNSMEIDSVYIFNKIITKDKVTDLGKEDYNSIYKNSFILQTENDIRTHEGQDLMVAHYVETDTPFVELRNKDILPESMLSNMIYIVYLDKLRFLRKMSMSAFTLLRVKINNVINFKCINTDNIHLTKKLYANQEIVDISFQTQHDHKSIFVKKYKYTDLPNYKYMMDYTIIDSDFTEDIKISIPSPYTMIADILLMLCDENIWIWEDAKYEKRIKRMFFLSLPCMYGNNFDTNYILNGYTGLGRLFTTLNSLPDIDSRLAVFDGHYNIIVNPYNDKIKEISDVYTTIEFQNIITDHLMLVIKDDSGYKIPYIEHIISNYIKTMIIVKYIHSNRVLPEHQQLVRFELFTFRIVELPNLLEYIKPSISMVFSDTLSSIYTHVRGTSHTLINNEILPVGSLPRALDPVNVDKFNSFMNDYVKKYEQTIINNTQYIIDILQGLRVAGINNITTEYKGESLY